MLDQPAAVAIVSRPEKNTVSSSAPSRDSPHGFLPTIFYCPMTTAKHHKSSQSAQSLSTPSLLKLYGNDRVPLHSYEDCTNSGR